MKEMEIGRSSKRLKNKNTHEETKDLISELPDHILVHILSFLPTQDAVKTVLLRRFGNLWRRVPVLDLNGCLNHDCEGEFKLEDEYKFDDIVHHVSSFHDVGTLDKLRLKYPAYLFYLKKKLGLIDFKMGNLVETEKTTASFMDKLVGYAINRKVKVLDLNFRGCRVVVPFKCYVKPDVFRSAYLTDMRLTACNIKSCREISLKALKVLSLDDVLLSDEIMEKILLGCPALEELSLVSCWGLGKLYCENANLKKLMLKLHSNEEKLHVSCPHVTSLEIVGWIQRATLLDVSSLLDASISFGTDSFAFKQKVCDDVRRLLQKISLCKNLTLCGNTILMLTNWNFRNVPCASFQWKNLSITLSLTHSYPGLCWLLKSCRSLETVTMYIDPDHSCAFEMSNRISHHCDGNTYWDLHEAGYSCLKSIIIHGYENQPTVIKMLKFMLKNATRLQKMVISIKKALGDHRCDIARQKDECYSCQVVKSVQHELSTLPRASSQAMIYVSS